MNVIGDYEKILEDNLRDELEWLVQEFELLFKYKKLRNKFTTDDIHIGSTILENIIENVKTNKNEELLNLLAITLTKIEHSFPEFF